MPPMIIRAIKGEALVSDECRDVVELLRGAYNDGLAGTGDYPADLEERSAWWCEANGKQIRPLDPEEEYVLATLIDWKYRAWRQGQEDAVREAAK